VYCLRNSFKVHRIPKSPFSPKEAQELNYVVSSRQMKWPKYPKNVDVGLIGCATDHDFVVDRSPVAVPLIGDAPGL
jgi:hypothetical protein